MMNCMERLKYLNQLPDDRSCNLEDFTNEFKKLRLSSSIPNDTQLPTENDLFVCISALMKVVNYHSINDDANKMQCIRLGIQCLGNLTVRSVCYRDILWNQYRSTLRSLFFLDDSKLKNYVTMVYHNILLSYPELSEVILRDSDLIAGIFDEACKGSEYPQYIIEKILMFSSLSEVFNLNKIDHRLYLMDLLKICVENECFSIKSMDIEFLSSYFKIKTSSILNNSEKNLNDLFCQEMSKLLSVICCLSSKEEYSNILQADKSLIIDSIYLLKALYSVEKSKMSDQETLRNFNSHVGFKGDLIRFIGNLSWKNKINQDLIRENNCIHIFLDCLKIDQENPFIREWSIYAIRNLCENNENNQAFISSMQNIDLNVLPSVI